jgi:hypothetical protein
MRFLRIAARFATPAAPLSTAVNPHQTHEENTMITRRTRAALLHRHHEAVPEWHHILMMAEQRKEEARSTAGDAVQVVW